MHSPGSFILAVLGSPRDRHFRPVHVLALHMDMMNRSGISLMIVHEMQASVLDGFNSTFILMPHQNPFKTNARNVLTLSKCLFIHICECSNGKGKQCKPNENKKLKRMRRRRKLKDTGQGNTNYYSGTSEAYEHKMAL